jgi:hypothetical protein
MTYIPSLLHAIETRLEQTTTEITRLEAALSALTATTTVHTAAHIAKPVTTKQRHRASTKQTRTHRKPGPVAVAATPEPAAPNTNTLDGNPDLSGERELTVAAADTSTPDPSELIANDAAPTARTTRRRRSAPSASRRGRATTKLDAETLERLLASASGALSAAQIADQAGASYPATLKLLRRLEASGEVRRSGERRSTSWRLITDEDRIAERVAELEQAATAPGRRRGRARAS